MNEYMRMTEEEIRPIAEDYVEEYCHCPDGEYTDGSLVCAGIGTALIVSRQLEKRIAELEKENAELKEKLEVVIALKDEEIGCIQTDFNTFKSKAKELLKKVLDLKKVVTKAEEYLLLEQAEQFLKDNA